MRRVTILVEEKHDPNRGLPVLAPNPSLWSRLKYNLQNSVLPSKENNRTRFYLKTRSAVTKERIRQLESYYYIIHPLSLFAKYHEMFMSYWWFLVVAYEVSAPAFRFRFDNDYNNVILLHTVLFFNVLGTVHVGLTFLTGYIDYNETTFVLKPWRIAKRYLTGYIICDVFSPITVVVYIYKKYSGIIVDSKTSRVFWIMRLIRVIRLKTAFSYFHWTTDALGVSYTIDDSLRLIIFTCFLVHFNACLMYLIPDIIRDVNQYQNPASWLHLLEEEYRKRDNRTLKVMQYYSHCLKMTLEKFHGINHKELMGRTMEDILIGIITFLCAMLYVHLYIVVFTYRHLNSIYKPHLTINNRYLDLNLFMERNDLPLNTRIDLRKFKIEYNLEFYFNERRITSRLSPMLMLEVNQDGLRPLLWKYDHHLPPDTVMNIARHSKQCLYLPGEPIMRYGPPVRYLFIIISGSVACYNDKGEEIEHLTHGQFFGEMELILLPHINKRLLQFIPLEVTMVYRINKLDFYKLVSENEKFYDSMYLLARTTARKYRINIKAYRDPAIMLWRNSIPSTDSNNSDN